MSDKLKVTFTTINIRNNGVWTGAENRGLVTHNRTLHDGNLDVMINYKVERQ